MWSPTASGRVGEEAQVEKAATPAAWAIWPAPIDGSASQGVTSTEMPSSISSCAATAACAGSERLSFCRISIIRPPTPPAALISSTASCMPAIAGTSA